MIWLGASENGLTSPIIFKHGETLSHENYIEIVLPYAQPKGERLLGDDFIYQPDNVTFHTHQESLAGYKENFTKFVGNHRWSPNSPDLNVLHYYVWDVIRNNMQWDKAKDNDSLVEEVRKRIRRVSKDDLLRYVKN
jgi:hypothetical protein